MSAPAPQAGSFARAVHDQLFGHILPFWTGPALDHEQGGWLAWMSNDLRVDRSQPKGLIVNSRILWAFSAVHRFRPDPLYRQMADRAFDFLMNRFWDAQHGGAFWRLDGDGRVLDDPRRPTARRSTSTPWRNTTWPSARRPRWNGPSSCSS